MEDQRPALCQNVRFRYSVDDLEFIPGLKQGRPESDLYYIPVFFDKKVLLKYMVRNEYTINYFRSGGEIRLLDGSTLEYGINKSGKMFCWLGDLDKMPEREQHYLLSENIESDHDVSSGLYDKLQKKSHPGNTLEQNLLKSILGFSDAVEKIYGVRPYKFDIGEVERLGRISRPVVWEIVMLTVNDLAKICVEAIDSDMLSNKLQLQREERHDRIMLLQKWFKKNAGLKGSQTMVPLYALRAWRNSLDHRTDNEHQKKLEHWCRMLNLTDSGNAELLYDRIVSKLTESYNFWRTGVERQGRQPRNAPAP